MKSFLEKLFAELPSFFSVFMSALTSPSKLIEEVQTSQDESDVSARGIRFFIVAEVLALVIAYAIPEWSANKVIPSTDGALADVGSGIVLKVLLLSLSCLTVIIAFRVVKHRVDAKRFVALYAYVAGVVVILTALVNSTTNLAKVDLEVARLYGQSEILMIPLAPHMGRVIEIQQSLETNTPITATDSLTLAILPAIKQIQANTLAISSKPTTLMVLLAVGVAGFAVTGWMIFVGLLYARRNGISTPSYVVVVIIAIIGIILVQMVIQGAVLGSQMQKSFTQ
ncbi:MAG: hypothetical protein ACKOE4_03975 [Candidatus Kapaibacterium sp.]